MVTMFPATVNVNGAPMVLAILTIAGAVLAFVTVLVLEPQPATTSIARPIDNAKSLDMRGSVCIEC